MELAPLSHDREGTPATEPAGNGQIVSGGSNGRRGSLTAEQFRYGFANALPALD